MLIWGSKYVKRNLHSGEFQCPKCQCIQPYAHMSSRRHGHLYWIPLIPMGEEAEYVECQSCRGTFDPAVLQNAVASQEQARNLLRDALLTSMVSVAAAGGAANKHIAALRSVLYDSANEDVDPAAIEKLVAEIRPDQLEAAIRMLTELEPTLSSEEKEHFVEAALLISMADGDANNAKMDSVLRISIALGVSETHFKGILASFAEKMLA